MATGYWLPAIGYGVLGALRKDAFGARGKDYAFSCSSVILQSVMSHPRTVIRDYRDLEVWQKAMDLVADCYTVTKQFPREELYGLTAQLRRSAVSVPSNIAEGRGRRGIGGFLYHLSVANGSLVELETQLLIAVRLGYLNHERDSA